MVIVVNVFLIEWQYFLNISSFLVKVVMLHFVKMGLEIFVFVSLQIVSFIFHYTQQMQGGEWWVTKYVVVLYLKPLCYGGG